MGKKTLAYLRKNGPSDGPSEEIFGFIDGFCKGSQPHHQNHLLASPRENKIKSVGYGFYFLPTSQARIDTLALICFLLVLLKEQ
jgi:hypothetical protein